MLLIIWQTPTRFYYKIVKGTYTKYFVGYENQYSHKVLFIIDLWKDLDYKVYKKRFSPRDILIKYLNTCIKKLERR